MPVKLCCEQSDTSNRVVTVHGFRGSELTGALESVAPDLIDILSPQYGLPSFRLQNRIILIC